MRHTTKNTHIVFHMSNFIQFADFFLLGKNPENLISELFLDGFLFGKKSMRHTTKNTHLFCLLLPLLVHGKIT